MAKATRDQRKKLATIRERYKLAADADRENRRKAVEDMEFVYEPGEQWPDNVRQERGTRPCYEFNKVRVTVKRIVNDMRANRPAGKVRGQEEGDKDTAETLEGLIRNIWNVSDGDTVIDAAAEYQVAGGMGAWRVSVDYASDDVFEQDIRVEGIRNPYNLYADPACQDPMKRDARFWFYTTKIPKDEYEAKYPKAAVVDFESETQFEDDEDWDDGERVRICEYWYKEPYNRTLVLLSDGRTVDATEIDENPESFAGLAVLKSRDVVSNRIKMCIASGDAILEEADWAGTQFPFVVVYGENLVIDGDTRWYGLARYAKDAQRAYNYSRTLAVEAVATAPQAKFWATPAQADGHTTVWAEAHKKNYPWLLYNPDPAAGGPPQRMGGADIPAALIQEMQVSSEDIKGVTGIYDASLGARSNETTGVAIRARQQQGEIAVYNFMDNLAKGIRRTWEILIDLIPHVYDTPRVMRVLGQDGGEKYVQLNQPDPMTGEVVNDLTRGKYDVTVTVGPSFATQRQEAAEVYMGLSQANPQVMSVAGDLIFKSLDLPYAEDIADRLRALLPPQIQQQMAQGKDIPPEAQAAMAQATQAMQLVEQQTMQIQQMAQEIQGEKADADRAKAEVKTMLADLRTAEANLKAQKAELEAQIARAEADLERRAMEIEGSRKDVEMAGSKMASQAEQAGQQTAVQIVEQALEAVGARIDRLEELLNRPQPQPIIMTGGGRRVVRAQRGPDGSLMGAEIEDAE